MPPSSRCLRDWTERRKRALRFLGDERVDPVYTHPGLCLTVLPHLAAAAALIGAKPQNELEGMLIRQMIACHAASLECHRRAMLPAQTIEIRQVNLSAASKLSRTYVALLEALSRHRGKGRSWSGSST